MALEDFTAPQINPGPLDETNEIAEIALIGEEYGRLTPAELRLWLTEEYLPDHVLIDPVEAYLETEFPGCFVETGFDAIRILDGLLIVTLPVHPWHDLVLAKIVNGMVSDDGYEHGFFNVDGKRGATVGVVCGLLAPRPVLPVVRWFRAVWSALKTAFLSVRL